MTEQVTKLFIATVSVGVTRYMEDRTEDNGFNRLHTIVAKDEDDARMKIYNHYEKESDEYYTVYTVNDIEFATHIE